MPFALPLSFSRFQQMMGKYLTIAVHIFSKKLVKEQEVRLLIKGSASCEPDSSL